MHLSELIAKTMEELGVKAIRPMNWLVVVRTEPIPEKTEGGIWLPQVATAFYASWHVEMPHMRVVRSRVIAAGPKAHGLKPGDRVAFKRLHFARWMKMSDGTMVGWVDFNQLVGHVEDEYDPYEIDEGDSGEVLAASGPSSSVGEADAEGAGCATG